MLDSKLKPKIIEVNTNPCLELSSPLLESIIPGMLDNAFKISLDILFPPPTNWP
jgi:tubulin polyglutamylase TTLL1